MTQPAARRASSRATPARKASAAAPKTSKAIKIAKPATKPAAKANGADEANGASLGPTSRRSSGSASRDIRSTAVYRANRAASRCSRN